MPYLTHFNLAEHPFSLTPDASLYFPGMVHQEVYESVYYAIERGEGIVKVSGEVGTGKTLLCRMLLDALRDKVEIAYLNNPRNDADWVVRAICREFGLDVQGSDDLYDSLNRFLIQKHAEGASSMVLVDEAQALGETGLESIRLLSNLETEKRKLLQIVLFGQPELDRLLARHSLRQVAQRINFSFMIKPLTETESIAYIRYRAKLASRNPDAAMEIFNETGIKKLVRAGQNNPRLMNILGDKSLLAAYAEGATQVLDKHVRAAIREARQLSLRQAGKFFPVPWWLRPAPLPLSLFVILASFAALAAALFIAEERLGLTHIRPWLNETASLISQSIRR
ncbi:MAG: MSHA biogenesis protein MshM [Alphaproteobacteria bacterium]|nr:MSHA biogenesis protein MshM [Alphaproteobacteria bacterium]